ncbi:MAG: hypothetical protein WCO05_00740 [Candidatus Moraniibacteriota bacterium]
MKLSIKKVICIFYTLQIWINQYVPFWNRLQLIVAESDPKEKEMMVGIIKNLIAS